MAPIADTLSRRSLVPVQPVEYASKVLAVAGAIIPVAVYCTNPALPVRVMSPLIAGHFCNTVSPEAEFMTPAAPPASVKTIQPTAQLLAVAPSHDVPSDDAQTETGVARFSASLRATVNAVTR